MSRVIKFEYIWKHELSFCKGVYTLDDIQAGLPTAPKSKCGGVLKCWELIAKRQFTGLTDVNGVEIYEGDIVSTDLERGEVTYLDRYAASCIAENGMFYCLLDNANEIEVIGNIHEDKS